MLASPHFIDAVRIAATILQGSPVEGLPPTARQGLSDQVRTTLGLGSRAPAAQGLDRQVFAALRRLGDLYPHVADWLPMAPPFALFTACLTAAPSLRRRLPLRRPAEPRQGFM